MHRSTARGAPSPAMVDLAIAEDVAFVVIAGDLYDGDWRDFSTGLFFAERDAPARTGPASCCAAITTRARSSPAACACRRTCANSPPARARHMTCTELGVALHGHSFPNARRAGGSRRRLPRPAAWHAQHRRAAHLRARIRASTRPTRPAASRALGAEGLRLLGARPYPRSPRAGRAALDRVPRQPSGPPRRRRPAPRAAPWSPWRTGRSSPWSTAPSTCCAGRRWRSTSPALDVASLTGRLRRDGARAPSPMPRAARCSRASTLSGATDAARHAAQRCGPALPPNAAMPRSRQAASCWSESVRLRTRPPAEPRRQADIAPLREAFLAGLDDPALIGRCCCRNSPRCGRRLPAAARTGGSDLPDDRAGLRRWRTRPGRSSPPPSRRWTAA